MAIEDIPGGAATQVAQTSGNPAAVGLTGGQYQQAQMGANRAAQSPIPVYDNVNHPEYTPTQQPIDSAAQQPINDTVVEQPAPMPGDDLTGVDPSKVPSIIRSVGLPSGEVKKIKVPEAWGPDEVKQFLIERGVKGLEDKPGDHAIDRFMYEFQRGGNITTNVGDYMKSHFPYLATEYQLTDDGDIKIQFADDLYGEDFDDLSPQERRDRMREVDADRLDDKYSEAKAAQQLMADKGEWDVAGVSGTVTKAIADPVALVPVAGQAGKAAQGYKAAANVGAKTGGVWGGAYGASEVLSERGAPTTGKEAAQAGVDVAQAATIGAMGGAVLGPAIRGGVEGTKKLLRVNIDRKLRSYNGAQELGKKYYEQVWWAQTVGMTSSEAETFARKATGLTVDDVFKIRTVSSDAIRSPAFGRADAKGRLEAAGKLDYSGQPKPVNKAVKAFDTLLAPLDSTIRKQNAWVGQQVKKADANILRKSHEYHDEVRGFFKHYRKLSKADRTTVGLALYNRDFATARKAMGLRGGAKALEAFNRMEAGLTKLGTEMKGAGIKFDAIDAYFPRMIKDIDGLKKFLDSGPVKKGWRAALDRASKRAGRELTPAEEVKLLNRYMTSGSTRLYKNVKSAKKRRVVEVTEEMKQFNDDPITSIDLHIRDATSAIERRKLFGDYIKVDDSGLENLDVSIAQWLTANKVDTEAIDALKPMLNARFGKGETTGWRAAATLRQGVGGITLGNPYSAIRQLGDNFTAAWQYGLIPVLQSMPKAAVETMKAGLRIKSKNKMNADAFGFMMEMAQEMDTGGVSSNMIKKTSTYLYKIGGFRAVDRLGKNVLINTAIRTSQKAVTTPKSKMAFVKKFGSSYSEPDLNKLMTDLKNGEWSDIVKQHIVAEVMEIQPISRSQMPQAYLNHPNGRMLYQFRSWGIKQFDLARRTIFQDLFSTNPARVARGARGLVLLTGYVGVGNVGLTQLQRWFTGRDSKIATSEDFGDEVFGQILGNFAINRYGLDKLAGEGKTDEFWLGMVPPALDIPMNMGISSMKMLTAPTQEEEDKWTTELLKTTTPGRLVELWALGGAEKENEKIYQERLKGYSLSQ